ncbi:MAG TPA: SRPBCC family protein [Labilithrix sp.]|jgi:uncharacterized protein YndB with AHSA1/START domain
MANFEVTAHMLVRKPVGQVFEAFVDPAITSRFWFTKSTGRLEPGKKLHWEWEMYGFGTPVHVKAVEPNARIHVEWGTHDRVTQVEWRFEARGDFTYVTVKNWGFPEDADLTRAAIDSKGGFTLLLAGAKIFLEHGIDPRFVLDHRPEAVVEAWRGR